MGGWQGAAGSDDDDQWAKVQATAARLGYRVERGPDLDGGDEDGESY